MFDRDLLSAQLLLILVFVALLPLEPIKFHVVFSFSLIVGFAVVLLEKRSILFAISFCGLASFLSLAYLSRASEINYLNDFRDVFRWAPLLLLGGKALRSKEWFQVKFLFIVLFFALFDVFILLLAFSDSLRTFWLLRATTLEMSAYISEYYRHIGLLGNPNFSALFYAISILWCLSFVPIQRKKLYRFLALVIIFVSIFLLAATMSRTAIFCLIFTIFFTRPMLILRFSPVVISAALVFGSLYIDLASVFIQRFFVISAFSSFSERLSLVDLIISDTARGGLLLGIGSSYAVTDNDYVTLITRFGFLGLFIFVFILFGREILKVVYNLKSNVFRVQIITFLAISSFAGGVIGSPSLFVICLALLKVDPFLRDFASKKI